MIRKSSLYLLLVLIFVNSCKAEPPIPEIQRLNAVSCTSDGYCITGGFSFNATNSKFQPYLFQSLTRGGPWNKITDISDLPTNVTSFTKNLCLDLPNKNMCIATGYAGSNTPLFIQTTNGGKSWSSRPIKGLKEGRMLSLTCYTKKNASESVCMSAGLADYGKTSSLAVSIDSGSSWDMTKTKGLPVGTRFDVLKCNDFDDNPICFGLSNNTLYYTRDNAENWRNSVLPNSKHSLKDIACSGSDTFNCALVGDGIDSNRKPTPLILQSRDGGESWNEYQIPNLLFSNGKLQVITCLDKLCLTGGTEYPYNSSQVKKPLMLKSVDNGLNWEPVDLSSLPLDDYSTISYLTCSKTRTSDQSLCYAAIKRRLNSPIFVRSQNKGKTWEKINFNEPHLVINKIECISSNKVTRCLASGYKNYNEFYISESLDDGVNWKPINLS